MTVLPSILQDLTIYLAVAAITMARCMRCGYDLIIPPSLYYLQRRFPKNPVDPTIDRSIPRCKNCEEVNIKQKVENAEQPSSELSGSISELEMQIYEARNLIAEGVQAEALSKALPGMRQELAKLRAENDPIKALERRTKQTGTLVLEGVQPEALLEVLPIMKAQLADMKKSRDAKTRDFWEPFWAIWGMPEDSK